MRYRKVMPRRILGSLKEKGGIFNLSSMEGADD